MPSKDIGRETLERVAGAVADGTPVDWGRELSKHPDLEPAFAGLRDVAKMTGVLQANTPLKEVAPVAEASAETKEQQPDLPGTWGRLQVRKRLAEGACAEIYQAFDPHLEREVALKIPKLTDEEHKNQFMREAVRLASVRHENVLPVHGAEERGDRVGMWTDLLEGQNLEELLKEQGRFGAEETTLVGVSLCRALAAIHQQELLHRDIKTANVMREEGGRIVLMDFSSAVNEVGEGGLFGDSYTYWTPPYRAPEIAAGKAPGKASDIYALGVLLYRLVTNRYPVNGDAADSPVTPLLDCRPDLDPRFAHVIERALEPNPEDRFASAGEMEQALDSLTHYRVETGPQSALTAERKHGRAWGAVAAVMAIGLAIALGWGLFSPPALEIEADLFRKRSRLDERLTTGAQLELGDRLFLEVDGTRPFHAYVLNEDMAGHRYVLFPLPGLELQNPLPPEVQHRLPGSLQTEHDVDGNPVERFWEVTSTGGEEMLVLIASAEPLPELESEMASIPNAGSAQAIELDTARVADGLRGIAGVVTAPESTEPAGEVTLSQLSEHLLDSHSEGLQIWQIRLRNPGGGGGG